MLVSFQEFDAMLKNSIPEIQRCNLTSVVLQLLALDINTLTFNFMDMPPKEVSLLSYYFKFIKHKCNGKSCMFYLQMAHKQNARALTH